MFLFQIFFKVMLSVSKNDFIWLYWLKIWEYCSLFSWMNLSWTWAFRTSIDSLFIAIFQQRPCQKYKAKLEAHKKIQIAIKIVRVVMLSNISVRHCRCTIDNVIVSHLFWELEKMANVGCFQCPSFEWFYCFL